MEILLSTIVIFVWSFLLALVVITTSMVCETYKGFKNATAIVACFISGAMLTYFACVLLTMIERSYYGIS